MARADSAGQSISVLRHHGKSFHFAGQFLGRDALQASARLYAFCRNVDDAVDLAVTEEEAHESLARIREDLVNGAGRTPLVADFLALSSEYNLSLAVTLSLLDGMQTDLERVRMPDEPALLRYCYQVAGTVGLHMAHILGATREVALHHAVDLGIAMQLTNIARDVMEDAERGRLYLPCTLVGTLEPESMKVLPAEAQDRTKRAVLVLLELAENYYASGLAGIAYLPRGARLGISVAAHVYREIGMVLRRRGGDFASGRAYVGRSRKVQLALQCVGRSVFSAGKKGNGNPSHDRRLHAPLAGLPFCNVETDSSA